MIFCCSEMLLSVAAKVTAFPVLCFDSLLDVELVRDLIVGFLIGFLSCAG